MTVLQGSAQKQLKGFVERVERLNEEKQSLADDIKEVVGELKASGFHVKTFRKVVALRKQDAGKRQEEESLLDLYMHALGMTPLETAIAEAAESADKAGGVSTVDPVARAAKKGKGKGKEKGKGGATSELPLGGGDGTASGEGAAAAGGEGGGAASGDNVVDLATRGTEAGRPAPVFQ